MRNDPLLRQLPVIVATGQTEDACEVKALQMGANDYVTKPYNPATLIFNSYLGGACILEYNNGSIELLRANDKYVQVIGSAGMTLEDALKLNWTEYMDEESRDAMHKLLRQAAETGEERTFEFVLLKLPGCADRTYLRSAMRVIAKIGQRYLIYCNNENITAQRIAEQRRQETTQLLSFLEGVAHELLTIPDADAGIHALLDKMLRYFDGNRCYIFEFDPEHSIAINTYELCAQGVTAEKASLQEVPLEKAAFWLHAFDLNSFVDIENVDSLGEDRLEKELLQSQGIHSLLAVPLKKDGKLIGFLGVDDPKQKRRQIESLTALGDYAVVLLTRRDMEEQINSENQEKLAVMDGIPGGFVRMQVRPDGAVFPVYHSEGFKRLVSMDQDQLMALYGSNAIAGVHPDDVQIVSRAVKLMLSRGEAHNIRYRLRRGNGGYIWVTLFGKMRKSRSGEVFLNVYYADFTEQKKREDIQIELLDNLPCGAALYEIHGDRLSVIHLNRHFWELMGSKPKSYDEMPVFSAVHPDDRDGVMKEIAASVLQKREVDCNLRILCGDGLYHRFHAAGRLIPQDNRPLILCVAYTPVSD